MKTAVPRFPLLSILLLISALGCGDDAPTRSPLETTLADAVPLTLDDVTLSPDGIYLVLLSSAEGDSLALPVHVCQADIIAATLLGAVFPRPLTHDLFVTVADSLGLSVTHVLLDLTDEGESGAHLLLDSGKSLPSSIGDALAIAQRTEVPLLASRDLLDRRSPTSPSTALPPIPPARLAARPAKAARVVRSRDIFIDARVLGLLQGGAEAAVVLVDADTSVAFPIFIGLCQAGAIFMAMEGEEHPILETHDLLHRLIRLGKTRVARVVVTELIEDTFIGRIDLASSRRRPVIDARPSDALALAVLAGAPIQVSRDLLILIGEDPAPYLDLFAAGDTGE